MNRILEIDGVCKAYADGRGRRQVLADVSLTVGTGEVLALRGPSGSGKSTLLNLVAGLLAPDSGEMRLSVGGAVVALHTLSESARTAVRRSSMGYVFQFFNLVPTLTVRENVLLPLELNRRADLAGGALDRLARLGLADRGDAFPAELSGGERQRVAIARALAHEPVLVLADEPTGNLDADNAQRVAELLWEGVRELDGALIIATHDTDIARRADQVIEMGVLSRREPGGAAPDPS